MPILSSSSPSVQAMNAAQAHEMLLESLKHPHLTAMVVPSPITFEFDSTVSKLLVEGVLGDLLYIEVPPFHSQTVGHSADTY